MKVDITGRIKESKPTSVTEKGLGALYDASERRECTVWLSIVWVCSEATLTLPVERRDMAERHLTICHRMGKGLKYPRNHVH